MKVNKRYRNIDRIKTLEEEHKYYIWWFDEYYSSSWNDDDDDRYIYYENKGNIRYEPSIDYWIIDMDTKDASIIEKTMKAIKQCKSNQTQWMDGTYSNIIALIETVNGWHIITHAFNLKQMEPFKCLYPFDVQKNNPTLLYFNKIE